MQEGALDLFYRHFYFASRKDYKYSQIIFWLWFLWCTPSFIADFETTLVVCRFSQVVNSLDEASQKTMSGDVFMTKSNHSFSCWGMLTNMTGLYTQVKVGYLQKVPNMLHTCIYFKSFVWSSELAKGQFIWYSELAKNYPLTPRCLAAVKALQFSIQKDEHSLSLHFGSTSFLQESLLGASELPPAKALSLQILKSVCKRKETELFLIFIYHA